MYHRSLQIHIILAIMMEFIVVSIMCMSRTVEQDPMSAGDVEVLDISIRSELQFYQTRMLTKWIN